MNLIWFLLRASWLNVAIASVTGSISGACSASLIALINNGIVANDSDRDRILLGFIGLAVTALFTSIISHFLLASLSYDAIYKLRLRLSNWVIACPLRHLEELGANRILATLTEDTDSIAETVALIPFICIDLAIVIGCLVYLFSLSWLVFLVTFLLLSVAIACVQFLFSKAGSLLQRSREEQDSLFKHFRTITDGIKELKLNFDRRRVFMTEELQVTAARSRRYDITCMKIFGISAGIGQLLFFVTIGFLVFGLPKFTAIETTVLSGYVLVSTYLFDPMQRVIEMLPALNRGSVALQKLERLGLSLASRSETIPDRIEQPSFKNAIELHQITHTYHPEGEENFTIGPIDLCIHPGELIFIVGGNGSGKSTLAKLITGLYIPTTGEIYVDGKRIDDRDRENYRQLFSTVFSDFYLFDRLLGIDESNLAIYGQKYLNKLQLEHKLHIENGRLSTIDLSQGQRKRLALLTAYLEDRPIYLFDEWAADQDPSFREIFYQELLPELKRRGKTILAISHDDRYFYLADRLIKLDYGKIMSV
jgi:putative pyoverdin transport system ATP-binding/permease protein